MATVSAIVDRTIEEKTDKTCHTDSKLIQKSNEYAANITKDINVIFRSVKVGYYKRFPELESIITQPALYCKAVREIEKAERGEGEARFAFLSNHQKMSLQLALSTIHEKLPLE